MASLKKAMVQLWPVLRLRRLLCAAITKSAKFDQKLLSKLFREDPREVQGSKGRE